MKGRRKGRETKVRGEGYVGKLKERRTGKKEGMGVRDARK